MQLLDFCQHPIIQAPMAGGATTPELVAAVSNAGAIGALAAPLLSPAAIVEQAERIRALTDKPFIINLFVQGTPSPSEAEVKSAMELLRPIWEPLGWESLPLPAKWCEDFQSQLQAVIDVRPAIVSFTFGILMKEQVELLHEAGIFVMGTATNVAEARAWEAVGADAVCAQGIEAGGHRGTFIGSQCEGYGTMVLVPAIADAVRIPVVAAGGIMDGRGIAAALALGAQAAQLGTAFLTTDEAGIHPIYKERLLEASHAPVRSLTTLTRSFSGRYARGLVNRFIDAMRAVEPQVPAYPVQNALTGVIRAQAGKINESELMSLWAGQGVAMVRSMPARRLVETLVTEWRNASI
ncbi:NAD(P)H-dependent flavin oxidoreductase [Noviherbaspirillum galbum]|uniref:Nitronate monooxygenase n=1 Tax=Noviherbaspirillum galbum TaxID=2709383 RepID=A0A6B3SY54_9BURK|nr:nitronate monooxygenase [Noviherbaspirillum galbum]NEX63542.1 nitronate monooxygenase [Noviherbaspirillum galbum]